MQISCSYNVQILDVFLMHLLSSGSLMLESCFTSDSHEILMRLAHTERTMQEHHISDRTSLPQRITIMDPFLIICIF